MKKLMLICAPVSSRSGYGEHARDLCYSLNKNNEFDIKILDVPWGNCPRNALDKNNSKHKDILKVILKEIKLNRQPDVYVDIRIPNEFPQHGKVNIGITAGIETTAVSQAWLEGCNKMDLIIVPSEHSKDGFLKTVYDKVREHPDRKQEKIGELKLEKPIEAIFEGADENIYKNVLYNNMNGDIVDTIDNIPEKFLFLSVGQWTAGEYGEDRKDLGRTIKVFYESFANKKNKPGLLLKTSGATFSILDREDTLLKIKTIKSKFPKDWKLPNVYLLHGDLSDTEMNYLYNHPKIKCMVSFTHGEGFGRPLLEATMVGLPIIASNWSGQVDFLDGGNTLLLPGELNRVPKSMVWKDIIIEESQWFTVDESVAYKTLNYVFENEFEIKNKAKTLMYKNREKFTLDKMSDKLNDIVKNYTSNIPTQVGITLPKLKKVNNDKKEGLPKLTLPKLKRTTTEVAQ